MYIKYILSILILSTALFSSNIEVIESFNSEPNATNLIQHNIESKTAILKRDIKDTKKNNSIDTTITKNMKENNITKAKKKEKITALNSYKQSKQKKHNKKDAKLVIIIDDISHKYQLKELQSLPFKVTPSIFPPTKMNMSSYKLARGLKHFMVHLPLESHSKQMNSIYKLLRVNSSQKRIKARVKEIRRLFPNAKYVNNHTGSKFTANYIASKKLYKALMQNGFIFVDSRTSIHTKIPKIAKEFHKRYLKSDLFIDNVINTASILKELKKGIALAKSRGYAVVIGHPHPQTIKALRKVAKYLKHIRTVYIDEL